MNLNDNAALIAMIQTQMHAQWLVSRAIDAAADALRHWYRSNQQPLQLDLLALYPHSLALDLSSANQAHVVTRIDIGLPSHKPDLVGDFIDLGTFWLETALDGSIKHTTLRFEQTQAERERLIARQTAPDFVVRSTSGFYLVNDYGSTFVRESWHQPSPAALIPVSLVAELRLALDLNRRVEQAIAEGQVVLAQNVQTQLTKYQPWKLDSLRLAFAHSQLVFPLAESRPIVVEVMLDLLGMPDLPLGRYHFWTRLDGTFVDDCYTLLHDELIKSVVAPQLDGIPAEVLIDLGVLNSKRQATLGRLIDVVGIDGLQRLMAEARTRVAELVLSNPDSSAPKSVRGMLWQMLEHDALDPQGRSFVLGLNPPKH
ncbi:hypothetical protein ACP8Y2_09935 [Herpetosiphon llansteffanensis]